MRYARRLTREEVIRSGIRVAVEDGHLQIYRGSEKCQLHSTPSYYRNPKIRCYNKREVVPYFTVALYEFDENNNKIKIYRNSSSYYTYKTRITTLQRVVWAWYNGEVPDGMTVDHINNQHEFLDDYKIENLQLLSPKDNIHKDSHANYNRTLKCSMKKPRSYFEEKVNYYQNLKDNSTGMQRYEYINILSRYNANLRYWDAHQSEYEDYIKMKNEVAAQKQQKKENIQKRKLLDQKIAQYRHTDKTRWHELIELRKNLVNVSLQDIENIQ